MTAQLFSLSSPNRSLTLTEQIQGTPTARIITEFVSTSALFPILDAIRVITAEGWLNYLSEPAHYVLFAAAFVQAWVLGTARSDTWPVKFFGNLLGFALYMPIDIMIEGPEFFSQPYHWLFGGFSLLMAIFSALQQVAKDRVFWQTIVTLLLNISKVALFPAIYTLAELQLELPTRLTCLAWDEALGDSASEVRLSLELAGSGHPWPLCGPLVRARSG